MAEQPGRWHVLRLPALAETQAERDQNNELLGLPVGAADPLGRDPGVPLCPQRFSREGLEQLRTDVGSLAWAGQYQGVPRAAEGNRFKRQWFAVAEAAPADAQRVRYWDKASSPTGDFTCGVLMARTRDGIYYIEDVVRGRWSPMERDAVMLSTAERDRERHGHVSVWCEQEPGSGGLESAQATARLLAGFPISVERVTGSKEVRAEPFAAQAEAGNVRLVRGRWNGEYVEELCAFPNGLNDDAVDGSSGAFNKLAAAKVPTLTCIPRASGMMRDPFWRAGGGGVASTPFVPPAPRPAHEILKPPPIGVVPRGGGNGWGTAFGIR